MDQKEQFEHALSHLQSGNLQMAAELCDLNLKKYPGDANFLCLSAKANIAMRNFAIAESRLDEAIKLFPEFPVAHETLGDLLIVQGRAKSARAAYEQAIRLDPTRAVTHDKIARAKMLEKQQVEVGEPPQEGPRMGHQLEIRKAVEYERNGDHKSAEMIYRDILTKDPDHVEAARLLAGIAAMNHRYRDAEVFLRKVLSNAPDYIRAWVDLANALREMDKFEEALEAARKVLELAPDNAESYMVYASALGQAGHHDQAIEAYEKAISISPDKAGAICGLAHHQKTIGRQAEAIASYRRAIALKPDHAEAYWSLANLKTFRFEDGEVEAMETLLESDKLPDESRAQLHNALGLEYEGRKDYEQAFKNFTQCNAVRRQHESYDPVETETTTSALIELFDRPFLEKNAGVENFDVTPILVVGLPRSGSTLIEQILASHSQVDGTHELGDLSRAVRSVRQRVRGMRFPDTIARLGPAQWRRIGQEYLDRTEVFRHGSPYFVDKNPNNFVFAGVLKLALPNAKIINARRHPLDSCFGSFKQLFAKGQPFTYDMTELAEYYLQYQRLMDHWHEVLPGYVLDVQYEDVVDDLDTQVRRILEFCGLPFEEACLRFHETERAVKTASSEQVRRPIYSSSVNLWRNYEPWLGDLIEILEPLVRDLPEVDRPAAFA